jgi:hypothetical protein
MYRQTNIQYRLIESLFRFKGRFLLILATALALTSVLLFKRMQTYIAAVSLRVPVNSALNAAIAQSGGATDYTTYTVPAKLHSGRLMDLLNDNKADGFMDHVIKRADMTQTMNCLPNQENAEYGRFVSNITTSEDSSEVFSLVIRWPNQKESERLVSALREEYVEWAGRTKVESTKEALKVVSAKRKEEEAVLEAIGKEINTFGQTNAQLMPGGYENDQALNAKYYMELGSLQAEYNNTVTSRKELEKLRVGMKEFIVDSKMAIDDPSTVISGAEGGKSTASTYTELTEAYRKKSALLRKGYLADGEDVKTVSQKIDDLKAQIADEKQEHRETPSQRETEVRNPNLVYVNTQIPNLKIDEKNILAEIQMKKKQILDMAAKLKLYPKSIEKSRALNAKSDAQQRILSDLRTKEKNLDLQIKGDSLQAKKQFENIGTVYAIKAVNNKNFGLFLIGGVFLGLVFGCVAVLISEISDPSLRYGEDVENGLGLPVLSVVPESRSLQGTELSPEFRWFKLDDLGK